MRRLTSGMFMSLDGVVDADDDWQFAYFDEELFERIGGAWQSSDAALMGRRSFEGYSALRAEHPDSPMLGFLQGVERYVASTTLTETDWPGTTVLGHDLEERLRALKQQPGGDILVAGSPTLVRFLLGRGLLDELDVVVLPIVVGSGDRLFPEASTAEDLERVPLRLIECHALGSGALALRYVPDGAR